jgi:hypothetical protein
MKLKKILIGTSIAMSVAVISGCATYNKAYMNLIGASHEPYSVNVTGKSYTAVKPSEVKLVYKDQPNDKAPCKSFETIGQVQVQSVGDNGILGASEIAKYFKDAGAHYGADAVINIKTDGGYGAPQIGYAIKCT